MTEHNHCGCGCEDHHDHVHHEEHHDHCGCGCEDHEHHHAPHPHDKAVTENQAAFLRQLFGYKSLPVARYVVKSTVEESFMSVALAPVFIRSVGDDMGTVKEAGTFLKTMAEADLITLDYDIPISDYPYDEYKNAALFAQFTETVLAGAKRAGFLGDTATQELGSIVLTDFGLTAIGE